jgi:hypothetical protein
MKTPIPSQAPTVMKSLLLVQAMTRYYFLNILNTGIADIG